MSKISTLYHQLRPRALLLATFPLLLAAALVLAGCLDHSSMMAQHMGGDQGPLGSPVTPEKGTVTVYSYDNYFRPNNIVVPVGETVTFVLRNGGRAIHNLRIIAAKAQGQDFASEKIVNSGQESRFTAVFDAPGTYRFVCDYHPGMAGQLTVEPQQRSRSVPVPGPLKSSST